MAASELSSSLAYDFRIFTYGFLGGMFFEILGMYRMRKLSPDERPAWLNTQFYWFWTIAMMLVGGFLALAYSFDVKITPLLGINIGASAPSILGAFAGKAPEISPGKID